MVDQVSLLMSLLHTKHALDNWAGEAAQAIKEDDQHFNQAMASGGWVHNQKKKDVVPALRKRRQNRLLVEEVKNK